MESCVCKHVLLAFSYLLMIAVNLSPLPPHRWGPVGGTATPGFPPAPFLSHQVPTHHKSWVGPEPPSRPTSVELDLYLASNHLFSCTGRHLILDLCFACYGS